MFTLIFEGFSTFFGCLLPLPPTTYEIDNDNHDGSGTVADPTWQKSETEGHHTTAYSLLFCIMERSATSLPLLARKTKQKGFYMFSYCTLLTSSYLHQHGGVLFGKF
jgi:hypothetical protein